MFPEHNPHNLIEVRDLVKYYSVRAGLARRVDAWAQVVDGVSFSIQQGETFGLVGENGCGKTTLARTMLRLVEPTSGDVFFEGANVFELGGGELRALRRKTQIISQDSLAALDPHLPVGASIAQGLEDDLSGPASERQQAILDALKKVGLKDYHARRYPHEFTGGQRHRIGIARALAQRPKFIVVDEPASTLETSIQTQILISLKHLQREYGLTYLFIARSLSVVEQVSDRVAVMYLGKLVELARRGDLLRSPMHPYAQALMSGLPGAALKGERITLPGETPSPLHPPGGCRFHPRCPVAMDLCSIEEPPFREIGPQHWAACWRV